MENETFALRAEGISKRYGGVAALSDVTLDIRPGEVLCLAGSNGSGKSTLIKILSGVEVPDSGVIWIDGLAHERMDVLESIRAGIQVIFQDMSVFSNLTVAENIALGDRVAAGRKSVNHQADRQHALEILSTLQVDIDPEAELRNLPVADRQIVAIARALSRNVKVLFMDEPTTALTWREVKNLFEIVGRLKESGVAVVFVSHKTEEVLDISDRIVVMRNGQVVADGPASEFDSDRLMTALLGYVPSEERDVSTVDEDSPVALDVEGLGASRLFRDVTLKVRKGEILGITGLLGSGRSEVAEALFGRVKCDSGTIKVDGQPVRLSVPQDAVRAGIAYVPPDRLAQGLFLHQSIIVNVTAAALKVFSGILGWLRLGEAQEQVGRLIDELAIKVGSPQDPASSLSGGNQQKVVLAKWLLTNPKVLVLNGPTVGVDAGAKAAIMAILRREAAKGMAVILISDDIPELVSVCHRVIVMRRGLVTHSLAGHELTAEEVTEVLRES